MLASMRAASLASANVTGSPRSLPVGCVMAAEKVSSPSSASVTATAMAWGTASSEAAKVSSPDSASVTATAMGTPPSSPSSAAPSSSVA